MVASLTLSVVASIVLAVPLSTSTPAGADPLASSSTCPDVTDSVVRLYSAYFLRAPDDGGFEYWADQWGSGAWDLPKISDFFAGSEEFKALYGGLSDGAFVNLVYLNVLGRPGEPAGSEYWIRQLSEGLSRGRLMLLFSDGDEYVSITATMKPRFLASGEVFDCLQLAAERRVRSAMADAEVVAEFEPELSYDRGAYRGFGYSDDDGDCIDARHETLILESRIPVTMHSTGCWVDSGLWVDPYDGSEYTRAGDVQIDHVVPLAHADRAGGWQWSNETKEAFYNDIVIDASLAVTGGASNGDKSDNGPDEWKPPLQSAWCGYAIDWIDIKTRWQLPYTPAEQTALGEMLDTCSASLAATRSASSPSLAEIVSALPPGAEPETPATRETVGDLEIVQCLRGSEIVVIRNKGANTISLSGHRLHDEGDKHSFDLGVITLAPGGTIDVLTGPDAVPRTGAVVWKLEHVWNNTGDIAFVIGPGDVELDKIVCANT